MANDHFKQATATLPSEIKKPAVMAPTAAQVMNNPQLQQQLGIAPVLAATGVTGQDVLRQSSAFSGDRPSSGDPTSQQLHQQAAAQQAQQAAAAETERKRLEMTGTPAGQQAWTVQDAPLVDQGTGAGMQQQPHPLSAYYQDLVQKGVNALNPAGTMDEKGNIIMTPENTLNARELMILGMSASSNVGYAAVEGLKSLVELADNAMTLIQEANMFEGAAGKASIGLDVAEAGTNTKVAKVTATYLQKLVHAAKNPYVVLGALGSYLFSVSMSLNERGDAATTLSVALNTAAKQGDTEGAQKLTDMILDITQPSLINSLRIAAPIINYPLAALQKWDATRVAAQTTQDEMRAQAEAKTAAAQNTSAWDTLAAQREAQRMQQRQADEAYYNQVAANQKLAHDQQRAADEQYWNAKAEAAASAQEQKRKDDQAFYEMIAAEKKKADEESRQAWEAAYTKRIAQNEAYWKGVQKSRDESQRSKLRFGFL